MSSSLAAGASTLVGVSRLPFLSLTALCVAVAAAAVFAQQGRIDIGSLLLVLVAACSAHISVNAFNEYFDFRSGLDLLTRRTPFSGGSGALPAHPQAHRAALGLALLMGLLTAVLGLYLASRTHWLLIAPGLLGLVLVYTYTEWLNRSPWLCLLAPGLGFGPVITLGAYWALGGSTPGTALALALIVGLLASNLLLLNQFPDVEADRQVGRRHYPIVIGRAASAQLFAALHLLAVLALAVSVWAGALPLLALCALLPALVELPRLLRRVQRDASCTEQLVPALAQNLRYIHLMLAALLLALLASAAS